MLTVCWRGGVFRVEGGLLRLCVCACVYVAQCMSCLLCFIKDAWQWWWSLKWMSLTAYRAWISLHEEHRHCKYADISGFRLPRHCTTQVHRDVWTEKSVLFLASGLIFYKMPKDNTKHCNLEEEQGKKENMMQVDIKNCCIIPRSNRVTCKIKSNFCSSALSLGSALSPHWNSKQRCQDGCDNLATPIFLFSCDR